MLKSVTRFEWLALLGVLLLAAGLRFGWPGTNSFAYDEARLSLISLRMARGGEFATLGMPSSARVPNLPAAAWIFALPYALSPDPLVATGFASLLSLLAVPLVWALARRAWGPGPALLAALFLAASPYAVLYGRSIWAQNLLAPIAAAWGLLAFSAIRDRKNWALAGHVFLAGFAFQVHFAGIALALASLYLFVRFGWWRRLIPVLVGGALAALAALPFALELLRDPALLGRFGSAVGGSAQVDVTAFEALARLGLALDWRFLALGDLAPADAPLLLTLAVAALLLSGLAAVVRCLFRGYALERDSSPSSPALLPQGEGRKRSLKPLALRERGWGEGTRAVSHSSYRLEFITASNDARLLAEIVFVWLVAAPLFFLRHSAPVFIHYLLVALPALALVAGLALHLLPVRLWRAGVLAVSVAVAAVWTVQIVGSLALAAFEETPNGLGTPLSLLRNAAYSVPDDVPVVFFTHGDDPNVDGEAAIFEALWWGRPHRIVRGDSLLILPAAPTTLMSTLAPFQAWEELTASSLAEGVQQFPRRDGALPYVAAAYDGVTEPSGFQALDPLRFDDGAVLEGWRVRRIGPRLRISTLWRVTDAPPDAILHQFHHLRPASAAASPDFEGADVALSVHDWQVGDRLVVMGDFFDLPPGDYVVDIGHYALPDLTRIPTTGGDDLTRLGPFSTD